jgi:Holliday junction DNA helicase RuvB
LSSPLRDRFGLSYHLDFYEYNELTVIVQNSSKILNLQIDEQSALEIAKRSRGTPRIANRLLRRIRDYIQVKNKKKIDLRSINESLEIEGVDNLGLDRLDRSYIKILSENFRGGPVGIEAITASLNEDQLTLIDVVEPFLLKIGFLLRTAQGRKLTNIAYEQIGKNPPMNRQDELI